MRGILPIPLALLAAAAAARAQGPAPPPQPAASKVVHRAGQTFLTWSEVPGLGDGSYRVYRSECPITDLARRTPIQEVWADSGEFYADRRKLDTVFPPRFVDRLYVPVDAGSDIGRRVLAGEGLLVWTLREADFEGLDPTCDDGVFHYAVTSVDSSGVENTVDLGPGNTAATTEAVADPLPVEVPHADLAVDPANAGVHVLIQYMDVREWNATFHAPNPTNCWWGEDPAEPAVRNALQYAYAYTVVEPVAGATCGCSPCGAGPHPVVLDLHPRAGNRWPAEATYEPGAGCAYRIHPVDVTDTWWFGFAAGHDYRDPGCGSCASAPACPVPPAAPGVRVASFTEARVLWMVHALARDARYAVDLERVYVEGHSMGGSGALSLALRYPNVFSAARASKPMTTFRGYLAGPGVPSYADDLKVLWGDPAAGELPVELLAPAGWGDPLQMHAGTSVWDWQDHGLQLAVRVGEDAVPVALVHGFDDGVIPFASQVEPVYPVLKEARRTWAGLVTCGGHDEELLRALPPALATSATCCAGCAPCAFGDHRVRRDESTPGLSNRVPVEPDPVPSSCAPVESASYGHDLEWSSSWNPWDTANENALLPGAPVDRSTRWSISVRTVGTARAVRVDVTPRRLQAFRVDPGASYRWRNVDVLTGAEVPGQAGFVSADAHGLLLLPGVLVTPTGNRLVVDRVDRQAWDR